MPNIQIPRLVAFLALAVTLVFNAHAANLVGNAMTVPNTAIDRVEIAFPQQAIGVKGPAPNYAMGGPAVFLVSGLVEKKLRPTVEKINQEVPDSYIRDEVLRATRDNLDRAKFPGIADIGFANIADAAPDQQYPHRLYLTFEVYFTGNLRSLHIALHALVVDGNEGGKPRPLFAQDLYYDVPMETAGVFLSPRKAADYWWSKDPETLRRQVREGADELVAMLNREVTRQPVKGRIPGPQIAWSDSQLSEYGVVLDEVGDRVWLRLRNGRLVSIPKPAE